MTDFDPVQNPYTSPDTAPNGSMGTPMSMRQSVRTGQIITFALIMGSVITSGIMCFLVDEANVRDTMLFAGIGIGVAFFSIVIAFVMTKGIRHRAIEELRANGNQEDVNFSIDKTMTQNLSMLSARSMTGQLIGQALCEGPAVVNAIFMLLDGQLLIHGAAIMILIIGIAVQVPTLDKRQAMIDEALR